MKHELFPKISTEMDAVVERLKNNEILNITDLGEEAVEKVIDGLKDKRTMTTSQVAYIEDMVLRAKTFMDSLVTMRSIERVSCQVAMMSTHRVLVSCTCNLVLISCTKKLCKDLMITLHGVGPLHIGFSDSNLQLLVQ